MTVDSIDGESVETGGGSDERSSYSDSTMMGGDVSDFREKSERLHRLV